MSASSADIGLDNRRPAPLPNGFAKVAAAITQDPDHR